MTKIKEYLAKGEKRYKFVFYAGIDNLTGKTNILGNKGLQPKERHA